jgi:hypothetical protein
LPATSFTAVVIVAVYTVLPVNTDDGVNVAVAPELETTPAMEVDPFLRVKLLPVIVDAFIVSLKVTVSAVFTAIPVEFAAGTTELTVGACVSTEPVVKLQE